MKRLLSILTVLSLFMITSLNAKTNVLQDETQQEINNLLDKIFIEKANEKFSETEAKPDEEGEDASIGFHQELKKRFIEGGPGFMGIVLLCLILGLAIAIERIIYLNLATSNSDKLTNEVEDALKSGGLDAAKEVCRNTPGPVASIFCR